MMRIRPQSLTSSSRCVVGFCCNDIARSSRAAPVSFPSMMMHARFSNSSNVTDPNLPLAEEGKVIDDSKTRGPSQLDSSSDMVSAIFRQQPPIFRPGDPHQRNNNNNNSNNRYRGPGDRGQPDLPILRRVGKDVRQGEQGQPDLLILRRNGRDTRQGDRRQPDLPILRRDGRDDRQVRNSQESRFDNRKPAQFMSSHGGDRGMHNKRLPYQDKINRNSASASNHGAANQSRHVESEKLRTFIDKLRQVQKPAGDFSTNNREETPAPIPALYRRPFLNAVNITRPPLPESRKHDWNNSRDASSTSTDSTTRVGFRMPQRDSTQRFNNDNNSKYSTRERYRPPTQRDDMQFLEGRQSRDLLGTKDASQQNTKNLSDQKRVVTLPTTLQSAGLNLVETSTLFRIKIDDLLKKLDSIGFSGPGTAEKDISLDIDTLEVLAMEFDIETVRGEEEIILDHQELLMHQRRADESLVHPPRPPVVCIMGHVDHGKTTLMDALRRKSAEQQNPKAKKSKGKKGDGKTSSNVAGTEAGGITQRISAFQVDVEGQDNKVTFLDTPGHAAFKAMRQSGSHAADVIVLVVAADDGVSEQTIEILDFYKSIVKGSNGGITMLVALNKIDKPGIEVSEAKRRIENQLLGQGIICEGMGGESEFGPPVQIVPTSGLTGEGLDELIESLILQSEIMDLRADAEAHAEGIVMDARMEKGHGVVADCIIRWGSIKKGDYVVSGTQASRVRMLKDVNDGMLERGIPSQPVRLVGFKSLPKAGDPITCVDSEAAADEMVEQRLGLSDDVQEDRTATADEVEIHIGGMRKHNTRRVAKFHDLAGLEESDGTIRIPIIVKADADGSLSAVRDSLVTLGENSAHKVLIDPIQEGVGEITPSDIQMAKESNACIFAFGLKRVDQAVMNLAESEGVVIRSNDIIYSLLDDAKEILGRYVPPTPCEQSHGTASIQAIFVVDGDHGKEKVAGLKVTEGNLYRSKDTKRVSTHFRVYRNGQLISPEGQSVTALSLRHFKKLVEEVRHGDECGLVLSGYDDFQEGDVVECYSVEMKTSSL